MALPEFYIVVDVSVECNYIFSVQQTIPCSSGLWIFFNLFVWYRLSNMGKGKGFPVHAIKACMGKRGIAPLILNLGTTRR